MTYLAYFDASNLGMNESIIISKRVMTSNLSRFESYIAYRFCYIPFVCYSLGTTTLQPKQLQSISSHGTGSFLTKMGINKNFPRAVAFGPSEFGGLALFDLHTKQGVLEIKMLMEHVYHGTETGKLIEISHLQMESGISHPILTNLLQPMIDTPTQQWPTYYDAARQVLLRQGPDTVYKHMTCVHSFRMPRHVKLFDAGTLTDILNTNNSLSTVPADFEVLVTSQYQAGFSTARKGQNHNIYHLPPTTVHS